MSGSRPLGGGGGSGTVTSVGSGSGLTGGPITTSGTLSLAPIADQRFLANFSGGALAPQALQLVAGANITFSATTTSLTLSASTGTGSGITSIIAGIGLTGGTITTSGTIALGAPIHPDFTTPVDGDFAWINQGTASITVNASGGIYLFAPNATGNNLRVRKKASPATPYTVTAVMLPAMFGVASPSAGLVFRQASDGKLVSFDAQSNGTDAFLGIEHWSGPTTFSAQPFVVKLLYEYAPVTLRIADNGTSRLYSISQDGYNFIQVFSETRTTFMTATEIGFYVNSGSVTYSAGATVLSWVQG